MKQTYTAVMDVVVFRVFENVFLALLTVFRALPSLDTELSVPLCASGPADVLFRVLSDFEADADVVFTRGDLTSDFVFTIGILDSLPIEILDFRVPPEDFQLESSPDFNLLAIHSEPYRPLLN